MKHNRKIDTTKLLEALRNMQSILERADKNPDCSIGYIELTSNAAVWKSIALDSINKLKNDVEDIVIYEDKNDECFKRKGIDCVVQQHIRGGWSAIFGGKRVRNDFTSSEGAKRFLTSMRLEDLIRMPEVH